MSKITKIQCLAMTALDVERRVCKLRVRASREADRAAQTHYDAVRAVVCQAPSSPPAAAFGAALVGAKHWTKGDEAREAVHVRYTRLEARLRRRARSRYVVAYVERVAVQLDDQADRRARLLASLDSAIAELRRQGMSHAADIVIDRAAEHNIVVF